MIFVTGAGGFVGRYVVESALNAGRRVRCLLRAPSSAADWSGRAEIVAGDLGDVGHLARAMEGCTAVLHIAGAIQASKSALWQTNVEGTQALCTAARAVGIRRFLYVSSLQANGNFGTEYGRSKQAAEAVVSGSGMDWTVFRPTQVYGSRDRVGLTSIARAAGRFPIVPVPGGGRCLIQPVYAADLAHVMLVALDRSASHGRHYDIAGPQVLSLSEFIDRAARLQDRRVFQLAVPMAAIKWVARLAEVFKVMPGLSRDVIRTMTMDKGADIGPARRDLDYAPLDVSAGLSLALGVSPAPDQDADIRAIEPIA